MSFVIQKNVPKRKRQVTKLNILRDLFGLVKGHHDRGRGGLDSPAVTNAVAYTFSMPLSLMCTVVSTAQCTVYTHHCHHNVETENNK